MYRKLSFILGIMLTVGLLMAGLGTVFGGEQTAEVGEVASDFSLKNLDGKSVSLSDFRERPVLINFWATFCVPCLYEMSILQEVYDEWRKKGLVLVSINMGESTAKVRGYIERYKLPFLVLLDSNTEVFTSYGIHELPTTLLIDNDGKIIAKRVGAFSSREDLEKYFFPPAFGEGNN